MTESRLAKPDPWPALQAFTPARIALGRAGGSLPTRAWLDFRLAHARARDAVHAVFDAETLSSELSALGFKTECLQSGASDRAEYLQRPDLGRRLAAESRSRLLSLAAPDVDLAIVVSDGLSALAAQTQAQPLLAAWAPLIASSGWRLALVCIVRFGRVAIEDEIGELLRARAAVILIGERPGLGAPDSLSAYLEFDPRPGRTDAERNCVSNIRPLGLPPAAAALKLHYLVGESLRRGLSGVALKDESLALGTTAPSQSQIGEIDAAS